MAAAPGQPVSRPARGARAERVQRASEGRKTSRGDIVIVRPAISLNAWPSTHDTISHLYGVDDGEALPFA